MEVEPPVVDSGQQTMQSLSEQRQQLSYIDSVRGIGAHLGRVEAIQRKSNQAKNSLTASKLERLRQILLFAESSSGIDIELLTMPIDLTHHWDKQYYELLQTNIIAQCRIGLILCYLGKQGVANSVKKALKVKWSQKVKVIIDHLSAKNMDYCFGAPIWSRKQQQSYQKYRSYKQPTVDKSIEASSKPSIRKQLEQNCPELCQLHKFLEQIHFTDKSHPYNRCFLHLVGESYCEHFVEDYSLFAFDSVDRISSNHLFTSKQLKLSSFFSNCRFYLNQKAASHSKLTVCELHQKKGKDYEWLESSHDYIQWLFPNHYKSSFNFDSYALGYVEAQLFRESPLIGKRLLRSFAIYLRFMGCRLEIQGVDVLQLLDIQTEVQQSDKEVQQIKNSNHLTQSSKANESGIVNSETHLKRVKYQETEKSTRIQSKTADLQSRSILGNEPNSNANEREALKSLNEQREAKPEANSSSSAHMMVSDQEMDPEKQEEDLRKEQQVTDKEHVGQDVIGNTLTDREQIKAPVKPEHISQQKHALVDSKLSPQDPSKSEQQLQTKDESSFPLAHFGVKISMIEDSNARQRLNNVLIRRTHNHLRIMRIIACLSITGFRLLAEEFIRFLKQLGQKQMKDSRVFMGALESNWLLYDCSDSTQNFCAKKKKKALQMCFLQSAQFPPSHRVLSELAQLARRPRKDSNKLQAEQF